MHFPGPGWRKRTGNYAIVSPHGPRTRFPATKKGDAPIALKYFGYGRASDRIRAEYQIVPMLAALFWEVEHSVIYKPSPGLKGVARSLEMQQRTRDEFANMIRRDPLAGKKKSTKKQQKS